MKKIYYLEAYAEPPYFVDQQRPEGDEVPSATVEEDETGLATSATYTTPEGLTLTLTALAPTEGRALASVLVTSWETLSRAAQR